MKRTSLIILILLLGINQTIALGSDSNISPEQSKAAIQSSTTETGDSDNTQSDDDYLQLDEEDIKAMGYPEKTDKNNTEEQIELPQATQNEDEIKLDPVDENYTTALNNGKVFLLNAERNYHYDKVEATNMFWDMSKNFQNTYFQDQGNQQPMPILFNTSYIKRSIGCGDTIYVGQDGLSDFNDISVDFVRSNETTYDNGAKIISNNKKFNLTTGIFDSTLNHNMSGGTVISSKRLQLPGVKGNFVFGGGYYTTEQTNSNKNSGGVFAQYNVNRLKLTAQAAKSKYTNSDNLETSLYFEPEYQLTKSLTLKSRFIKNIAQDTNQDEIGLAYKPRKNNPRDLELQVNAINAYSTQSTTNPRINFSAKFKI